MPQGSVLGPLYFALYLESLLIRLSTRCDSCNVYAYADDLKIVSSNDKDLQNALNIIHEWATEWKLTIQPTKSEYISLLHKTNTLPNFYLNKTSIPYKDSVKDLGVVLRDDLKWSSHIQHVSGKTVGLAFSLLRSFQTPYPSFYINLFKTYVRPIIEYNSTIWNPTLISETRAIEKIQRKFTKYLCKKLNIGYSDYFNRLHILNLETLEERRIKTDLINLYKILNDLVEIDFKDLFKFSSHIRPYNFRGHSKKLLPSKFSGTTIRHNFFLNRTIPTWNNLPEEIINTRDINDFKNKLKHYSIYQIYKTKLLPH